MRERINRLARGILDAEMPQLVCEPEIIDEKVRAGEKLRGDLFINSRNGLRGKGLIYSSDPRVKAEKESFGGLRNRISYLVDTTQLQDGEDLEGSFYFVTNGGELEVPYSFHACAEESDSILASLKTAEEFAALARRDYDMALRLFEYRDFVKAPFLKDPSARALYDGLRAQSSRHLGLEQFFLGLKVKEPVLLSLEESSRDYPLVSSLLQDEIVIRRKNWGYLPVQILIQGDFIQTGRRTLTDEDFVQDVCTVSYEINPGIMHGGINSGSITFRTPGQSLTLQITAHGRAAEGKNPAARYLNYHKYRLAYEASGRTSEELAARITEEVEQWKILGIRELTAKLMEAEWDAGQGRYEDAAADLEAVRDEVMARRGEDPGLFCIYQYISLMIDPDGIRSQSLQRLLSKLVEEKKADILLMSLYIECNSDYFYENPAEEIRLLKTLSGHSPYRYLRLVRVWNSAPETLDRYGELEAQALYMGARLAMIAPDLQERLLVLADAGRPEGSREILLRTLKRLYAQQPSDRLLQTICSLMIRCGHRSKEDFTWYQQALDKDLDLTRLYEYYLYSLPEDDQEMIPRKVLLYFSYSGDMDRRSKEILYANIVRYLDTSTALYKEYERRISEFAAEELLAGHMNARLALIYREILCADMIDEKIAAILPSILRSFRIVAKNPQMRAVVVCYEELTAQSVYPLQDGMAYIPVYSDKVVLLLQDAYGNRYADQSILRTRALDKPELEEVCRRISPDQSLALLARCSRALTEEQLTEEELEAMVTALRTLELHPLYRQKLQARLLTEILHMPEAGERIDPDILLTSVRPELMDRTEKTLCLQALIHLEAMEQAGDFYFARTPALPDEDKALLASYAVLHGSWSPENTMDLAIWAFRAGIADEAVLDHLCEHWNGSCQEMYDLLRTAIRRHVETYDLEERLLAQMLFCENLTWMDRVFAAYAGRKNASETLVKAYFTMKCAQYFLEDKPLSEEIFHYLEELVLQIRDRSRLSTIYLLTLTRYYAEKGELTQEERDLCQEVLTILIDEDLIFPYFRELDGIVKVPSVIMDKAMIQYKGSREDRLELMTRVLPMEEEYHRDEISKVFQGIWVAKKILFEGEIEEYQIYRIEGGERLLVQEGSVSCSRRGSSEEGTRYQLLNRMTLCRGVGDEEGLKQTMEEYVKRTAAVEEMFRLMP